MSLNPFPHDDTAEIIVLGGILLNPAVLEHLAPYLTPDDFSRESHAWIYQAQLACLRDGRRADVLNTKVKLEEAGRLEAIGGISYLIDLSNDAPLALDLGDAAAIVMKKARDRRAILATHRMAAILADETRDFDERIKTARAELDNVSRPANGRPTPLATITLDELLEKEFADIKWAVPNLIPEGLTLFAGRPKMGKSWLALGLGLAVASGGLALGKIPVIQGDVLYLALEDTQRRLQSRSVKLLAGRTFPSGALEVVTMDANFPRLHEGGLELIAGWLDAHPNARLIFIDTLARVRAPSRAGGSVYEQDYQAMQGLLQLAGSRNVAVVVIHHTRKGAAADALEEVSGSFGLSGGVDGVLVLKRDRTSSEAVLAVTGRDVEEQELALQWDAERTQWTIAGNAEDFRISKERKAILDILQANPTGLGPKSIAGALAKPVSNIKYLLNQMVADSQIAQTERGRYIVNPVRTITPNLPNHANDPNLPNLPNLPNHATEGEKVRAQDEAPNLPLTSFTALQSSQTAKVSEVREVSRGTASPTVGRFTSEIPPEQKDLVRNLLPKRGPDWARIHMEKVSQLLNLGTGFQAWPIEIRQLVEKAERESQGASA